MTHFFVMLTMLLVTWPVLADSDEVSGNTVEPNAFKNQIEKCQKLEDSQPKAAINLAQELLAQINPDEDLVKYGHILGCMAWAHVTQNKLVEARSQALAIEQLVAKLDTVSIDLVQLTRRAGGIFHRLGDRVSASENYNLAMQQAESIQLVTEQIPILVNLGVLNSELREHQQAIENYYQALDLMAEIDDQKYRPPVLFNLAATLNGQNRYTEALKVFQQVESMINEQWPPGRVAQTYHGLAAAHTALGNYEKAKDYAYKALDILEENDQIYADYYNAKSVLAAIYADLGEADLAIQYANAVRDFYLDPENKPDVISSINPLHSLASTYENLGLLKQSIEMYKEAKTFEQNIQDSFNQEIMAQMQVRLNDIQEREELALLKSERINDQIKLNEAEHRRRDWMLISGGAVLVFVLFLYWQFITNKKLRKITRTDTLTQLGNRRFVKDWLACHKLPNEPACRLLWLIDLDHFKAVNDEYDHDVGDYALQELAAALHRLDNNHRAVARWGGEEFIIITDDVAATEKDAFSKLLLDTIKNTTIQTGLVRLNITASVGISLVQSQSASAWNKALYDADKALYTAKSRGRDCVVLATSNGLID